MVSINIAVFEGVKNVIVKGTEICGFLPQVRKRRITIGSNCNEHYAKEALSTRTCLDYSLSVNAPRTIRFPA